MGKVANLSRECSVFTHSETVQALLGSFRFLGLEYLKQRRAVTLLNEFQQIKLAHKNRQAMAALAGRGSAPGGQGSEWIGNLEMMRQKIDYLHQNPVKRGYIEQPEHWRYSSARDYAGVDGLLPVDKNWWG